MADRALSDALGFVLVFALILSSVSVVYVQGYGGLQDVRDAERLTNAERAFDVLADNMDDLHRRGAPNRGTEIKLSDAQLRLGETTRFVVTVTFDSVADSQYVAESRPIVYTLSGEETELVYSSGAVIRTERGTAGVLKESPDLVFAPDGPAESAAIVSLVQTRAGDGTTDVAGSTTTLVRAETVNSVLLSDLPADADANASTVDEDGTDPEKEYDVTFTVETTPSRAVVWERLLDDRIPYGPDPCSLPAGGDTVTCTFYVERLFVTADRVDVTFD
jgi:hypothetical protein